MTNQNTKSFLRLTGWSIAAFVLSMALSSCESKKSPAKSESKPGSSAALPPTPTPRPSNLNGVSAINPETSNPAGELAPDVKNRLTQATATTKTLSLSFPEVKQDSTTDTDTLTSHGVQDQIPFVEPLYLGMGLTAITTGSSVSYELPIAQTVVETSATGSAESPSPKPTPAASEKAKMTVESSEELLPEQPGKIPGYSKEDVKRTQEALRLVGLFEGTVDGIWGPKTSETISKYQVTNGFESTGRPGPLTWAKLHSEAVAIRSGKKTSTPQHSPTPSPSQQTSVAVAHAESSTENSENTPLLPPSTLNKERGTEKLPGTHELTVPVNANVTDSAAVTELQKKLNALGYNIGSPTGTIGPRTSAAIKEFQRKTQLRVTGNFDASTVKAIQETAPSGDRRTFAATSAPVTSSMDLPKELARLESKARTLPPGTSETDRNAVLDLLDQARRSSGVAAEALLVRADKQIETLSERGLSGKAHAVAVEVEGAYSKLRNMYSNKLSTQKEVTPKLNSGFESMKSDLNRGNYNSVVEKGPGFKNAIDRLTKELSRNYVADVLNTPAALSRMSRNTLQKVQNFHKQGRDVEAAELAQKEIGTLPQSTSGTESAKKTESKDRTGDNAKSSKSSSKSTTKKSDSSSKSKTSQKSKTSSKRR